MNQLFNLFDAYTLRVRFSIGLILLTPFIISIYLLIPNASNFSFTVITLVVCFGLCNLIMSLSRYFGRKSAYKCFPKLMPAQQMLIPEDTTLDSITKNRYYKFLSSKIENLSFTQDENIMAESCKSAVKWLISQTRDAKKFPLIKEESINFGFSKNLYGLKYIGIISSFLLSVLEFAIIIAKFHLHFNYVEYTNLIASFLVSCSFMFVWVFLIKKDWVIYNGYKYARELLAACDSEYLS